MFTRTVAVALVLLFVPMSILAQVNVVTKNGLEKWSYSVSIFSTQKASDYLSFVPVDWRTSHGQLIEIRLPHGGSSVSVVLHTSFGKKGNDGTWAGYEMTYCPDGVYRLGAPMDEKGVGYFNVMVNGQYISLGDLKTLGQNYYVEKNQSPNGHEVKEVIGFFHPGPGQLAIPVQGGEQGNF